MSRGEKTDIGLWHLPSLNEGEEEEHETQAQNSLASS